MFAKLTETLWPGLPHLATVSLLMVMKMEDDACCLNTIFSATTRPDIPIPSHPSVFLWDGRRFLVGSGRLLVRDYSIQSTPYNIFPNSSDPSADYFDNH